VSDKIPYRIPGRFAVAEAIAALVPHRLLAGSATVPPALAFASHIVRSDAPALAYATLYPLTVLLRILCAQVLVLTLIQ
jgi:uncharacterized transporter YbjL